jgi:hypothetical protein
VIVILIVTAGMVSTTGAVHQRRLWFCFYDSDGDDFDAG